jgi:hypothetical protein
MRWREKAMIRRHIMVRWLLTSITGIALPSPRGRIRRTRQCSGLPLCRVSTPNGVRAGRRRVLCARAHRGHWGHEGVRAPHGCRAPVRHPLLSHLWLLGVLAVGQESGTHRRGRGGIRRPLVPRTRAVRLGAIAAYLGTRGTSGDAFPQGPRLVKVQRGSRRQGRLPSQGRSADIPITPLTTTATAASHCVWRPRKRCRSAWFRPGR